MVAWRGLSIGGSFGRVQVVLNWTEDNWSYFDGWCCARNIDPIGLPAYRFYNLALISIKETLNEDQLLQLEEVLKECDLVPNPLKNIGLNHKGKLIQISPTTKTDVKNEPTVEDQYKYVPPWWQGEEANAKIALSAMTGIQGLPKMNQ